MRTSSDRGLEPVKHLSVDYVGDVFEKCNLLLEEQLEITCPDWFADYTSIEFNGEASAHIFPPSHDISAVIAPICISTQLESASMTQIELAAKG